MKSFRVPKDIVFGWGSLEYLKQLKGKKAFLVTDPSVVQLGAAQKVEDYL